MNFDVPQAPELYPPRRRRDERKRRGTRSRSSRGRGPGAARTSSARSGALSRVTVPDFDYTASITRSSRCASRRGSRDRTRKRENARGRRSTPPAAPPRSASACAPGRTTRPRRASDSRDVRVVPEESPSGSRNMDRRFVRSWVRQVPGCGSTVRRGSKRRSAHIASRTKPPTRRTSQQTNPPNPPHLSNLRTHKRGPGCVARRLPV